MSLVHLYGNESEMFNEFLIEHTDKRTLNLSEIRSLINHSNVFQNKISSAKLRNWVKKGYLIAKKNNHNEWEVSVNNLEFFIYQYKENKLPIRTKNKIIT